MKCYSIELKRIFFPKLQCFLVIFCLSVLVHAFVTSRVDHCNGLLYGSYSYLLDRLQSVLNSAARLVLNVAKFSGISAICDELHWLPIRKRIEFKIVFLLQHCLVGAAPEYLMELCRPVSSAAGLQSLRSASRGDLIIPRFRLRAFGFRAFAISGLQLWNSLPWDVRQSCDNLIQFKMKLKTFFCSSSSERFCGSNLMKGLTSALYYYYYYFYFESIAFFHVKLGLDSCPRVDNQTSVETLQDLTRPLMEKFVISQLSIHGYWSKFLVVGCPSTPTSWDWGRDTGIWKPH